MTDEMPALDPAPEAKSLPASGLYHPCDPAQLPFDSLDELEPLADHFGQDRAVEALEFGLEIGHEGFNVFLLGSTGVGKRELLETMLTSEALALRGELSDWCYVNNFESPDHPIALSLPPGRGNELRKDMAEAVETLLAIMPATFQGDEYQAQVQALGEEYQEREKAAFQSLAEKAGEHNVAMIQTPSGYTLAPTKDGEFISPQDFEALPAEDKEKALAVIVELKDELKIVVRQLPGWKMESRDQF